MYSTIIDKKNCTINDIIELNMDSAIKIPCGNDDERPWTGNAIEQKKNMEVLYVIILVINFMRVTLLELV